MGPLTGTPPASSLPLWTGWGPWATALMPTTSSSTRRDGRAVRPAGAAPYGAFPRGEERPMRPGYFFTSLTRISDLPEGSLLRGGRCPRREWETGDYVVGEVASSPNRLSRIELASGRMVEVAEGDLIVGAFGVRYATLEAVGGWQGIGRDRMMEALTGAGLFGKATSRSTAPPPAPLPPLQGPRSSWVTGRRRCSDYVQHVPERASSYLWCCSSGPRCPQGRPHRQRSSCAS